MKILRFLGNKNVAGKQVVKARTKERLSQEELAIRLQTMGVSIDQQAISKIEKNLRVVTDYELMCLSQVLNVSIEWLLEEGYRMVENSSQLQSNK